MNTSNTFLLLLLIVIIACTDKKSSLNEENSSIGVKFYEGPIIDMHIHAYDDESDFIGVGKNPKGLSASESLQAHQEETFARFKKFNIVKAAVSSYGETWYEQDSSLVLIGKGFNFPEIPYLRELHQEGKLHVLGEIGPFYYGLAPTDEKLMPYYDLAVELDIPVALHMYPGGPSGVAYSTSPNARAYLAKPLQLEDLLVSRPTMRIYIMHAGWPFLDDMKALMFAHPQVYVDIGAIDWTQPRKEFHNFLQGLVDAGFGKRILFGTDQMQWPGAIDLAIESVNSADFLTLEQKEDIFYNNAARFLRLSGKEIELHKRNK